MQYNRNLKSLDNKTGEKIKKEIWNMLDAHAKYKNSYFWKPYGNASQRAREEFEAELIFKFNGQEIKWGQALTLSSKNFYWKSSIYVDGAKKNITFIKKLIKE